MKRLIFVSIIILLLSNVLFAQSKHFEGYDGLAWGSSVQDLKKKYPDIEETTDDEDRLYNQSFFKVGFDDYYRVFSFFNNKLYEGRTVYENIDELFLLALDRRLKDEYGSISGDVYDKYQNDYYFYDIGISKTLYIKVEVFWYFDKFGKISSSLVSIESCDPGVSNHVREYIIEQKKKDIEL
jgi:hypothetical protein